MAMSFGERPMWYGLDEHGNPVPLSRAPRDVDWQHPLRRVAQTTLSDDTRVSTVFLGLDHQFFDGPPLVFETMVFPGGDTSQEGGCWRYATRLDAALGHAKAVRELLDATPGLTVTDGDEPPPASGAATRAVRLDDDEA